MHGNFARYKSLYTSLGTALNTAGGYRRVYRRLQCRATLARKSSVTVRPAGGRCPDAVVVANCSTPIQAVIQLCELIFSSFSRRLVSSVKSFYSARNARIASAVLVKDPGGTLFLQ